MPSTPNEVFSTEFPRVRVAAIITKGDEILLVQHLKNGQKTWLLPGGGVDFGESLPQALERELEEELCVEAITGAFALMNEAIDPKGSRHLLQICFHAEITRGVPRLGVDPRVVGVAYKPIADLGGMHFHPAMGAELQEYLSGADNGVARYLGNIWQD